MRFDEVVVYQDPGPHPEWLGELAMAAKYLVVVLRDGMRQAGWVRA